MDTTTKFKLYFVIHPVPTFRMQEFFEKGLWNRLLCSFAYKENIYQFLEAVDDPHKVEILLDSGAFTTMTQGKEVDIDAYVDFLWEMKEKNFKSLYAICLDTIPTELETTHLNKCARETFETYQYIRSKGIDFVVPVYHTGEPLSWLDKIVEEGCDYITVGGVARRSTRSHKRDAFRRVFIKLSRLGYTGRMHGLGVYASEFLKDFPWYSVDAATASLGSGFGSVYVFDPEVEEVKAYNVSGLKAGSSSNKVRTEIEKKVLVKYLNNVGLDIESWDDLSEYYVRLEASYRSWRAFEKFLASSTHLKRNRFMSDGYQGSLDDEF